MAVALAVLLFGGYWFWHERQAADGQVAMPTNVSEPAAAPGPAAAPEPAIRHPVEALAGGDGSEPKASAMVLPPLQSAITALVGPQAVASFLQVDRFAQRLVATVDNLPRAHAAPRLWPVTPTPGRFNTEQAAGGIEVIAAANHARYEPWVHWLVSVDTARAVSLYLKFYPLFQKAYQDLGYPRGYFNDRLVDVIDHLLATPEPQGPLQVALPEVKGPLQPVRPWVLHEFTDPALARLSSGQKILLRIGPAHRDEVKRKLADVRSRITVTRDTR